MRSLLLVLLAAVSLNVTAGGASNVDAAKAKWNEYTEAFNAGDIQRIVNEIYATPVQVGLPNGHMVMATPEDAMKGLGGFRAGQVAQGFTGFRLENVEACELSASLVLLDTQYTSVYKQGPKTVERPSTMMYLMSKTADGWRIIAYYGHDHDKRPSCG